MARKEITGKPTVLKEVNIGLIKDTLLRMGHATRVELCRETGISQPTINVLIKELAEKKIVCSLGAGESIGGRRAEIYTLNWKRNHFIAIAVDENSFQYCIFDLALVKEAEGTCIRQGKKTFTEQLLELLGELLEQTEDITAIAIGIPGAVSSTGQIFAIPQIPEWEQFDLKKCLEETYGVDVVVVNDINATAMGYLKAEQNAGSSVRELVYFYVGEKGLGAGIVIGGKLHCGCSSFAGEVGYMQIASDSIETQLSRACEEERVELLSKVITNIICVLDPQQIVLGGRVTKTMVELIDKACQKCLPLNRMPEFTLISDSREFYFWGLETLGQELADHQIRLQQ
ncbi:MAG: ROK family protein [Lachnospiraceae bacterium]